MKAVSSNLVIEEMLRVLGRKLLIHVIPDRRLTAAVHVAFKLVKSAKTGFRKCGARLASDNSDLLALLLLVRLKTTEWILGLGDSMIR